MTKSLETEFTLFIEFQFDIHITHQVVFVPCIGIVPHVAVYDHPVIEQAGGNCHIKEITSLIGLVIETDIQGYV